MKILIVSLLLISSVFASSSVTPDEAQRLCKVFSEKVEIYKKQMRDDSYAQKTLESYEERAKIFCKK